MRLSSVANSFNTLQALDAYTGYPVFKCQLDLYSGTLRDSASAFRRSISINPLVTLPVRRVVNINSVRYILGHSFDDGFSTYTIRRSYVGVEANDYATIQTLGELCRNDQGRTAWAAKIWVRDATYVQQSSRQFPQYHINFASTEVVVDDLVITIGGITYIIQAVNHGVGGTIVAMVDELPLPTVETATATLGTYDPITEALTGSTTTFRAIRMRWQSNFQYSDKSAPVFSADDIQLGIAKAVATPKVGNYITISDGMWQVMSVDTQNDVWVCRMTKRA